MTRHEAATSSETREPKAKADAGQSAVHLTRRTEAKGSLGGGLMTHNVGGEATATARGNR